MGRECTTFDIDSRSPRSFTGIDRARTSSASSLSSPLTSGHKGPDEVYWYLQAVPELLELATERSQRTALGGAS